MARAKRGTRPASEINVAPERPARADAVANRARILAVAAETFDRDGLAVSLDEIARRAGLGPGTLHRHFPTKAALIDATVAERVQQLAATVQAHARAGDDDPAAALVAALTVVVEQGAASHALADRLRRESGDIDAAVAEPAAELRRTLATLLRRAQRAGAVRPDLDTGSLDALLAAAHTLRTHPSGSDHLVQLLWSTLTTSD
ncbi:MAG TPA: helix-turn-helix domain-containing protein [Acidimicrobiales bacterium]|nr:helix-turn-helix domain-containing protein [Acidimicrobiales bacterium]